MEKPEKNTYLPVSLAFTNIFGADPKKLPLPGERDVLGVATPSSAGLGTRYMLEDGTIWEYVGYSGCEKADKRDTVNGWMMIWEPS